MKRIFVCLVALFMALGSLSSCAGQGEDDEKIRVVCTSFVPYDWTRELVGDRADVEILLLVGGGKDMHSYSPSAADVKTILKSDLLIYTGGVSETWVKDIVGLENSLSLMELLGENVKCVDCFDESHDGHEESHTHGEIDEHIWLSLKNAALFCESIKDELCRIDAANADTYAANCEAYLGQLWALDDEYVSFAASTEQKTLVVADRYPYRYLFEDYGFACHAAFSSCSSESEASFSTVIFLAEKIDELGLGGIVISETSDGRLAETVRANTKAKNAVIYTLHSLQSVTDPERESYLSRMQSNLAILGELLG